MGGRKLAQSAWAPPDPQGKVSDELLRWHFQQCVLTNIKGAGEPKWEEDDFGEQNEIAQIMELGDGPSRMEEELFNRLGTYMEVSAQVLPEWVFRPPSCFIVYFFMSYTYSDFARF